MKVLGDLAIVIAEMKGMPLGRAQELVAVLEEQRPKELQKVLRNPLIKARLQKLRVSRANTEDLF